MVLSANVGPLATIQNAVKLDNLEDPVKPIELIMEHCGVEQLAEHYQIEHFSTAHELTSLLAFRFGKLVSGGAPDTTAAARLLLKDWSNGSVQFYTKPPEVGKCLKWITGLLVACLFLNVLYILYIIICCISYVIYHMLYIICYISYFVLVLDCGLLFFCVLTKHPISWDL